MTLRRSVTNLSLAFGLILTAASTVYAQAADPVVEQARSAGQVGEQVDGYLGIVNPGAASGDLKARVDQINIKRRAFYTDLAVKRGVTVMEVAGTTACQLFKTRIEPGQFYRSEDGAWQQRQGNAAVKVPAYCN